MKIEIRNNMFKVITADEGMVLTEWKEGDDILTYSYTTKQFSPLDYDTSLLREITLEENEVLVKEQEERIKELNELENGKNL